MHPLVAFNLFGAILEIKSYNLFALLGALAGTAAALPLLRREGLPARGASGLLICMAAAFLAGARLFNFALNPAAYSGALNLWSLRLVGLSLYGGICGSLLALLIWSRAAGTSAWPLLDAMVLPTGLAFAWARLGCYFNGCCAGRATASRWGVAFPIPEEGRELFSSFLSLLVESNFTVNLYPTQLFELALALLGLIPVAWFYYRRRLPPGAAFLIYGIWFSLMRLLILPLRSLPYREAVTKIFYPLFYIGLIGAGLYLLKRLYKRDKPGEAEGPGEKSSRSSFR
ncbi:MAG: hypothetical protein GX989_03305 [Firmicutes bacterium]|nr:hypothetical protein [Bacillota bacterium]